MNARISSVNLVLVALALAPAPFAKASNLVEDVLTTSTVKTTLLGAEGVDALAINVDTRDAVVLLHGEVTSDAERTRAGALALDVEGVGGVRNLLAVVPESERPLTHSQDERLRQELERAITSDPGLAKSMIEVASIHAGHVLLVGRTDTLAAHAHALALIDRLDGVVRVESEIRSPDAVGDVALWEASGVERPEPRQPLAQWAADAWITLRTKLRLMSGLGLSPLDVAVETEDGVVTLSGVVDSELRKDEVAGEVLDVDGVIRVANELAVPPTEAKARI